MGTWWGDVFMRQENQVALTKTKGGKILIAALAIIVILALAAYLAITFGNPQWHPNLYAYQARHSDNGFIDPAAGYTGQWNNWDGEGRLMSTFEYRNGQKDGPYITYTAAGEILSEGQYRNGELDGTQKVRQDGGSRTEIPYQGGRREGIERTWYANGQVAVEAPWVDGLQDGPVNFYYENGSIQSTIPFYKGKREGVMKTFFEDGSPQGDENYRDDLRNGKTEFRRPDGSPDMQFNYRDDKMDGVQIWYHPGGGKAREIAMSMGIPHGEWREWDESGTLIVDEEYDMGELKKNPEAAGETAVGEPDNGGM